MGGTGRNLLTTFSRVQLALSRFSRNARLLLSLFTELENRISWKSDKRISFWYWV